MLRDHGPDRAAQLHVLTILILCFVPQMVFYGFTTLASALLNARNRFVAAAFAPVVNNVVVIGALLAFVVRTSNRHGAITDVARVRNDLGLLLAARHRHDGRHRRDGPRARARRRPRRRSPAVRPRVARPRDPHDSPAVGLDRGLRDHEPARAAVRARARQQLRRERLRVRLRVHVLRRPARPPRGLDHDDDDARTSRAERAPTIARVCATSSGSGLRYIVVLVLPASVLFVVLAQPMLAVIVRHQFTAHDAVVTADTLQAFAISLVPFSVYLYVMRAFYALQDTRTPFLLNAFENGLNIVLAARAVPPLRCPGPGVGVERRLLRRRRRSRCWSCAAGSAGSPTRPRPARPLRAGVAALGAGRRRGGGRGRDRAIVAGPGLPRAVVAAGRGRARLRRRAPRCSVPTS